MAAVLNTNMASLYAQKNLSTAQASLAASVQRLSSGTRINSAKDDAAGYGISESVRGTKNIVDQNIRNVQDGISWAQTAEGALDVVGKILQRSLTLATEASDGTLNSDQLASIGKELQALGSEINNIQQRTKFQGGSDATSVFGDCGWGHLCVNTGAEEPTHILAAIIQTDMTYCSNSLTNSFDDIASNIADGNKAASTDVADIQNLITRNATNRGNLGAAINSLNYAVDNMQTLSNNLADGISRIVDTDYAAETANLTKSQILQQAATSMLAQANQMPNVILTLLK